ncbi:MAG: hypothetical protein VYA34_14035 [Myxococcota bacterium]|nr:hypothetical protein [Myxococcota bacterium]
MQDEFNNEGLDIRILAVDLPNMDISSGMQTIHQKGSLPALQDTPEIHLGGVWNTTFRDVVIVGKNGERLQIEIDGTLKDTLNLTHHSLGLNEYYNTLKDFLLNAHEHDD